MTARTKKFLIGVLLFALLLAVNVTVRVLFPEFVSKTDTAPALIAIVNMVVVMVFLNNGK